MRSEEEGKKMVALLEKSDDREDHDIAMGVRWMLGESISHIIDHRKSLKDKGIK
jgi:hypothetical protein